jgi:hypothetical protein
MLHHIQAHLDHLGNLVQVSIQGPSPTSAIKTIYFEERKFINCWLLYPFSNTQYSLATMNQPLTDVEQQAFLLEGLGSEYDLFITSVTTKVEPLSIEEIYGHLLAHELRLRTDTAQS